MNIIADRFWVGGSGNWSNNVDHWAATSGGVAGASVPTSVDSVYFNASSFTTTGQIVTMDVTANCLNMDWTGATNNPTLAGTGILNIYGSLTFIAAMTDNFNAFKELKSTQTGRTITTNGLILSGYFKFTGSGGWTLQDDLNVTNGYSYISHTYGSLNTNSKSIICGTFYGSNSSTRILTLGSSIITCSGDWTFTTTTGLAFNAGTSTIIMTGNAKTFTGGGLTYNNVEFIGTPITVTGSNIFNDLKLTAGKTVNFTAGTTQTVTTLSGNGTAGNLITIQSVTADSPAIILSDVNQTITGATIKDIIALGKGNFIAYNSINVSGNTGWYFLLLPSTNNIDYIPFSTYEFEVNIYEEIWDTILSNTGYLEINNSDKIGCLPIITLTISNTYNNNPILRFKNGVTFTDISLGTSISSTNSPIIINCQDRITTNNNIIYLLSYYPIVGTNKFFSIEFLNNDLRVAIPISIYYLTYDITPITLNFRNSISLQNTLKQIKLPKKYYNSFIREKYTVSSETKFDIERNVTSESFIDISEDKTYHVEIDGINEDDNTTLSYVLGNVSFESSSVDLGDGLVTEKLSGVGILL